MGFECIRMCKCMKVYVSIEEMGLRFKKGLESCLWSFGSVGSVFDVWEHIGMN